LSFSFSSREEDSLASSTFSHPWLKNYGDLGQSSLSRSFCNPYYKSV
jgi:hypothetical protein